MAAMVNSSATTVKQYLADLPADRRKVISAIRTLVRRSIPKGYRETMNWGMITWEVPLSRYPDTYNGRALCYVALAAQKGYNALYLSVYQDPAQDAYLKKAFRDAGKKLDMGKACVRFREVEDLPLEAIGKIVAWVTPEKYIARYEESRKKTKRR